MADIFLITPLTATPESFVPALTRALEQIPAAALLVPRGGHAENAYKVLVKAVLPVAQARDVAVLIEGQPGDVRLLKADGLHVAGDIAEIEAALDALKPDYIVGAACDGTRDDAMSKAELGIDYVFFGPISGSIDEPTRELARWWAETMEVPSVLSDPKASTADADSAGCEFLGLGAAFWEQPA